MPRKYTTEQRIRAFWSYVKITDLLNCWEWQAGRSTKGYGIFHVKRITVRAHRFAWELIHGPIPKGLQCLHICDNRLCVNPNHLYIGTHADNMRDMIQRNRQARQTGEQNGNSKLTTNNILQIKALLNQGVTYRAIASKYNIHPATVNSIKNKQIWKHII